MLGKTRSDLQVCLDPGSWHESPARSHHTAESRLQALLDDNVSTPVRLHNQTV